MLLEGSCHCGAIRFRVESSEPSPFMNCYCSICRKTAGGGGFAINLGADAETMEIEGEKNISVYHARMDRGRGGTDLPPIEDAPRSPAGRRFCSVCGSALWLFDPRWPDLIHPHASAIDTPLPEPPERNHIMLDSAASWCEVPESDERERHFPEFPDESLAGWHERHGLKSRESGAE
ncbi:MAG: GFA family protein [Actinomycetota bacterium]|nr:GFA family protein [Rubrobacter sp.]MDQ3509251.1 GFA family protein [Actinomycetota bacterium]